jgi:hypothetical protein
VVFCLRVGRLAIELSLDGFGYDLTGADIIEACDRFMAAAEKRPPQGAMFRDVLLRRLTRTAELTPRVF